MPDVIVGKSPSAIKKTGKKGCILLGKQYVEKANEIKLEDNIYLDVSGAHVMMICGKRGGGKTYTMGVIAEGFVDLDPLTRGNISMILVDTMGVYWTMGHPNKKEADLLKPYNLAPKSVNLRIFTPEKYYYEYKKKGIRTDYPFSICPHQLSADDWAMAFKQDKYGPNGIFISKIISELDESNPKFLLDDIFKQIDKDTDTEKGIKDAVRSMFEFAKSWGLFSDKATPIEELAKGGEITVVDVSCYATMPGGWDVKALVVGLISQHLFTTRMAYRKKEELADIQYQETYFAEKTAAEAEQQEMPLVWLVIDEAHEFLPNNEKEWNAATKPLVTIMREGRQPGICLMVATQQPGKIHSDVMTQSDIVLSHRITARMDVKALGLLAQSYMEAGIERAMNELPAVKGSAVLFDDANEKIYKLRIRPRFTWHGGSSPSAVKE
jgi:DNA helicase HerA-like ATPase